MRGAGPVLWRGRLKSGMLPEVQKYLSSFDEDAELVDIDCDVGEAHALTLRKAGLFGAGELRRILRAYGRARDKARRLLSRRQPRGGFHDIHPVIERMVIEACGEKTGGRVHLGKSRNDQVAADIAIYSRRRLLGIVRGLAELQGALIGFAGRYRNEQIPALTHVRVAQPATAGFLALAHAEPLARDAERLLQARARMNISPLGSCAVAGTGVPLDRRYTAKLLGFDGVSENALDATGARDNVLEVIGALAIVQGNLSRIAADVMHLSAEGIAVLDYPDELADASSAMPHKKNPDPLELVRARAGRMAGEASAALAIVGGLPAGYSRDLQELKPVLWRSLDRVGDSLRIAELAFRRLSVRRGRARAVLEAGFAAALDLAEILSLQFGVPFRRAHRSVGQLVQFLHSRGMVFSGLDAAQASRLLSRYSGSAVVFTKSSWRRAIDPAAGIGRRRAGGPGATAAMLARARSRRRRLLSELALRERRESRSRGYLRNRIARSVRNG